MTIDRLRIWRHLRIEKDNQLAAIQRLESEMERVTARYMAAGSGSGNADSSKIPAQIARLEELKDKHLALIVELETVEAEIDEWRIKLPPEERMLIDLRYKYCKSWTQIALKLHYSRRAVFYLHQRALNRNI